MKAITLTEYKRRLDLAFENDGLEKSLAFGDQIPVQEWVDTCNSGGFIDYDGNGHFSMMRPDKIWINGKMTVYPSDITRLNLSPPTWATHVIWFNK